MSEQLPPNLDVQLAAAFAEWSEARSQLARLRAQAASPASTQPSATQKEAALSRAIGNQQAQCERLWDKASAIEVARSVEIDTLRSTDSAARGILYSGRPGAFAPGGPGPTGYTDPVLERSRRLRSEVAESRAAFLESLSRVHAAAGALQEALKTRS